MRLHAVLGVATEVIRAQVRWKDFFEYKMERGKEEKEMDIKRGQWDPFHNLHLPVTSGLIIKVTFLYNYEPRKIGAPSYIRAP